MIGTIATIVNAIVGIKELPTHACLFYRKEGYSVGAVKIDLILDEHHEQNAQVTESPMQDGRAISDGIYQELRDGTLTALVTNHSIRLAEEAAKELAEQGAYSLLDLSRKKTLKNRAAQTWNDLLEVQRRGDLVTIVTALEVYDNVAITHLATNRDGTSGDALEIEVGFRQVEKVQLQEDRVSARVQPKDMESDINRASAVGVNGGQVVAGEPTAEQKAELNIGIVKGD